MPAKEAPEAKSKFVKLSSALNLKPEWFGKTFKDNNHTYRIVGLSSTPLRKYGISIEDVDTGGSYGFDTNRLRAIMTGKFDEYTGAAEAKNRKVWKEYLEGFGEYRDFPKMGAEFQYKGKMYTVIGARDRGTYNVVTEFGP